MTAVRAGRSRRTAAGLLPVGLALAVLLTGCTSSSGSAAAGSVASGSVASGGAGATSASGGAGATSDGDAYPVVAPRQGIRIDAAAQTSLAGALQAGELAPSQTQGRVTGPALEMFTARLAVAKVTKGAVPAAVPLTDPRIYAPVAGDWPRWFLVAGAAAGATTPQVRLYTSPGARDPYALWGQAQLLPGATFPEPLVGPAGVERVTTGEGLVLAPTDVAVRYADLLTKGAASAYAGAFAADTFRAQVEQRLAADRAVVVGPGIGTITDAHAAVPGAVYALRTMDGGAVVVALLRQTYLLQVTPGKGTVTADADFGALAGRATFTTRMERRADEVLVFQVPASGQVRLVAAAKADVSASGS